MKRSKQVGQAGFHLESNEVQNPNRRIVYLICLDADFEKLKKFYFNEHRCIRIDRSTSGVWLYLKELKSKLKYLVDSPVATIRFVKEPFICRMPFEPDAYKVLKKAFFWQTWKGAPYYLDPELHKRPVVVSLQWTDEIIPTSMGANFHISVARLADMLKNDEITNFTFSSLSFLMTCLKIVLEKTMQNSISIIKKLKESGLMFEHILNNKLGIGFTTATTADGLIVDLIVIDGNVLPMLYCREVYKWIKYNVRHHTQAVTTLVNFDTDLVEAFRVMHLNGVPGVLREWKLGDYKGINKDAFERVYNEEVFALDEVIYNNPWPTFAQPFNVFRAYWPASEADDRQQRGPDLEKLVAGQVVDTDGFLATAYRVPPQNFLGSSCCLMVIRVFPNTPLVVLDNDDHALDQKNVTTEHEVLFPMGTRLMYKERRIMEAHDRAVDVAFFDLLYTDQMKFTRLLFQEDWSSLLDTTTCHRPDLLLLHAIQTNDYAISVVGPLCARVDPFVVFDGQAMTFLMSKSPDENAIHLFNLVKDRILPSYTWLFYNASEEWVEILLKNKTINPFLAGNVLLQMKTSAAIMMMLTDDRVHERFDLVYALYNQLANTYKGRVLELLLERCREILDENHVKTTIASMIKTFETDDWQTLSAVDPRYFSVFRTEHKLALLNFKAYYCMLIILRNEQYESNKVILLSNLTSHLYTEHIPLELVRIWLDKIEMTDEDFSRMMLNFKLNGATREAVAIKSAEKGTHSMFRLLFHTLPTAHDLTADQTVELWSICTFVSKQSKMSENVKKNWLAVANRKLKSSTPKLQPILEDFIFYLMNMQK